MNRLIHYFFLVSFLIVVTSCGNSNKDSQKTDFSLTEISIEGQINQTEYTDVDPNISVWLTFSDKINSGSIDGNIILQDKEKKTVEITLDYTNDNTVRIKSKHILISFSEYTLLMHPFIVSESGTKIKTGKSWIIKTGCDRSDKFPRITDEELLEKVQRQTFKYFWNLSSPISGMAKERSTSGNTVTTGGTGFGIMAVIVASERGFITREEALERVTKITEFLDTKCTDYHGAFAHWINGETGATIAFSQYDSGGDLVETSFLFQGLLAARAYFNKSDPEEKDLRTLITKLWENVDWNWYRKNNENTLYWHWSKDYDWKMNMKITGWNECLITYVLAAASPTHSINKEVYDNGWTRNGAFINGNKYYGHKLPLGGNLGGPMFFSHYSFLGLNPTGLTDRYADYWEQNKAHSLINQSYCADNPKGYAGYSTECWGLTASDGNKGYSAHSPTNDKGVIAPTAAISSIPYVPEQSLKALRFFYYKLGDKLWKEYGFVDAFNLSENWFDNQYIAIDQGPIIVMIENYRSGLLWSLFMSDPEIQNGLRKLGFNSPNI